MKKKKIEAAFLAFPFELRALPHPNFCVDPHTSWVNGPEGSFLSFKLGFDSSGWIFFFKWMASLVVLDHFKHEVLVSFSYINFQA